MLSEKNFHIFLFVNLIFWTLIPCLRESLPMDTQEAIVWGKYSLWGTTKHPPLSGWIAYPFFEIFQRNDWSMYLLSQLFIFFSIIYIYKLAKLFLDEKKALLASILQFGIIYYNFSSVEFNVNLVSLVLWPACAYHFWKAYQYDKIHDWLLFGLVAGLNILNKYVGGLLLLAIGLFIISDKHFFKIIKNYKVYISIILGILLISPHLYWLYENNFEMLNYIATRNKSGEITSIFKHIVYPLKFIGAQILFRLPTLITYFLFYYFSQKQLPRTNSTEGKFILILGLFPLLFFVFISMIKGTPLKSMWGFPCLFLAGITLCYFFPIETREKVYKKMFITMICWSFIFGLAYILQISLTRSERFHTNCPQFTKTMTEKWLQKTNGKPLEYTVSEGWFSNIMSIQSSYQIKPMIWMKPKSNPWFDENDFHQKGAMIITSNLPEYEGYKNMYPGKVSEPEIIEMEFHNFFGKSKIRKVYYGYYNVE